MLSVFPEKYFIKAIADCFFRVYIALSKHSGGGGGGVGVGRILESYDDSQLSQLLSCLDEAM